MTCAPSSSRSCCVCPFTVAAVPTGMKAGVSITPCGVVRRPSRAPDGSVARTSKRNPIEESVSGESGRGAGLQENENEPDGDNPRERFAVRNFLRICGAVARRQQEQRPNGKYVERAEKHAEPLGGVVRYEC